MPNTNTIMEMVRRKIKPVGAIAVFVASDDDHMIKQFRNNVKVKKGVSFYKQNEDNSLLDLVILGQSSHSIANCQFLCHCQEGEICERSAFFILGFTRYTKSEVRIVILLNLSCDLSNLFIYLLTKNNLQNA